MQLGKYEILEELGQGGFGVVYKAHDTVLDVVRAVKVLHPALVADSTFLQRFKQEARLAARLEHPNLVPVYDFAEAEGRFFLAMKYMPGKSLKDLLSLKGKLEQAEALELFRQVCEGVAYAHQQGIVHRDLKPGNVLIDADGSVRVSDMGFAKAIAGSASISMSATGAMIGTPPYMAPEIWRGKPATQASDQYSLACILYEMLTGEVLFDGESPADVMTRHVLDAPSFSDQLPEGMRGVLQTALAKDPSKRFHDLAVFTHALEACLQPNIVSHKQANQQPVSGEPKKPEKQPAITPSYQQPGVIASAQKTQVEKAPTPSSQQPAVSAPISIPATGKKGTAAGQVKPEPSRTPSAQVGSERKPGRWAWGIGGVAALLGVVAVIGIAVLWKDIFGPKQISVSSSIQSQVETIIEATNLTPVQQATSAPTNTSAPTTINVPINTSVPTTINLPTKTLTKAIASQYSTGDTQTREKDGMVQVYIPAGSFMMGRRDDQIDWMLTQSWCSRCEHNWFENEQPAHEVRLDEFWMDKYEVSNAQYEMCWRDGQCGSVIGYFSWSRESYFGNTKYADYPVINISWIDAQAYCEWTGGKLPTEAQWEYAAIGDTGWIYPWGDQEPTCSMVNGDSDISNNICVGDTAPVGAYPSGASPFGVLNMAGNVWEWVSDWYSGTYYSISPSENPSGPVDGSYRVLRGGSWASSWISISTANRGSYYNPKYTYFNKYYGDPERSNYDIGFRCISSD